ncbi:MAG TPA: hypothetical protein V6C52_01920 [Coleofasciculaceae cyanobacterium]|jgi:hypothetical protein
MSLYFGQLTSRITPVTGGQKKSLEVIAKGEAPGWRGERTEYLISGHIPDGSQNEHDKASTVAMFNLDGQKTDFAFIPQPDGKRVLVMLHDTSHGVALGHGQRQFYLDAPPRIMDRSQKQKFEDAKTVYWYMQQHFSAPTITKTLGKLWKNLRGASANPLRNKTK